MAAEGGRGGPQQIPRPATVRAGGPPPWSDWIDTDPALGLDDVRRRLSAVTVDDAMSAVAPDLRRSAVAVLISSLTRAGGVAAGGGSGVEVLLTRRAWTMRTHRGEVSFAGGAEEDGDDFPVGTALREASEEIALVPDAVRVICPVDRYVTITGFEVTPVIGVIPPDLPLVPSAAEVADWFEAPLDFLLDPANHREREIDFQERKRRYYEIMWNGRRIWGATAAMIVNLAARLRHD